MISKILGLFLCSFMTLIIYAREVQAESIQVTWTDNSANEDGFRIERKVNTNGTYSTIASVGPDVSSYSDSSVASSITYCYRVRAFNSVGNSAYTNEACKMPETTPPPPEPPTPEYSFYEYR